jgi:hypothetical protein
MSSSPPLHASAKFTAPSQPTFQQPPLSKRNFTSRHQCAAPLFGDGLAHPDSFVRSSQPSLTADPASTFAASSHGSAFFKDRTVSQAYFELVREQLAKTSRQDDLAEVPAGMAPSDPRSTLQSSSSAPAAAATGPRVDYLAQKIGDLNLDSTGQNPSIRWPRAQADLPLLSEGMAAFPGPAPFSQNPEPFIRASLRFPAEDMLMGHAGSSTAGSNQSFGAQGGNVRSAHEVHNLPTTPPRHQQTGAKPLSFVFVGTPGYEVPRSSDGVRYLIFFVSFPALFFFNTFSPFFLISFRRFRHSCFPAIPGHLKGPTQSRQGFHKVSSTGQKQSCSRQAKKIKFEIDRGLLTFSPTLEHPRNHK